MSLITSLLLDPGSEHSRPGTLLIPQGIVIHSTATVGAGARAIRAYFEAQAKALAAARAAMPSGSTIPMFLSSLPADLQLVALGVDASANFVVDDKEALCIIPVNEVSWHAGPTANHRFLSIEFCEFDEPERFHAVYLRGIAVVNEVMDLFGWQVQDQVTVWSHHETSLKWHETSHVDPDPFFAKHNHTWAGFLQDLKDRRAA